MAEHDGKVIFDLEIDTSKARSDLNRALSAIKNFAGSTKIKVDADTGGAVTQLGRVKSAANDLGNTHPTVTVNAQTSSANTLLEGTKSKAADLERSDPTVSVNADTNSANTSLDGTKSKATDLEHSDPTVTVNADTGSANGALDTTLGKAQALEASDPTITVTVDSGSADTEIDRLTKKATSAGSGEAAAAGESGNVLAKIGGGAALLKTAKDIFFSGVSYDYGLAKVSTLAPEGADLKGFGEDVLAMSKDLGVASDILLEGAYGGLSASVPFGNARGDTLLSYLRNSTLLATSGYTDSATAGDALTSVYNAYNGKLSMGDIANLMLKTQNKGKITVGEIAQSVAQITPAASVSGVGFDQVGAMWAALTAGGVQPAQAATQIRALFNELNQVGSKGNTSMMAALKGGKYDGKSLTQIMESGGTMVEVLDAIQKYAAGKGKGLTNFFSSSEASGAVSFLTGENLGRFLDSYAYMNDGADAVSEAYGKMTGTTQFRLDKAKSGLGALMVRAAEFAKPYTSAGLDLINGLLGGPKAWLQNGFPGVSSSSDSLKRAIGAANTSYQQERVNAARNGTYTQMGYFPWDTGQTFVVPAIKSPSSSVQGHGGGRFTVGVSQYGDRDVAGSPAVADAQSALIKLGYDLVGEIDGIFGKKTMSGVEAFQREHGLDVTGAVDAKTAEALEDALTQMATTTEEANTQAEAVADSLATVAEAQAQTAEATAQTAANAETTAQNEANTATATASAAKSAANSASRAARLASSLVSINNKLGAASSASGNLGSALASLIAALNNASARARSGAVVTPGAATKYAVGLDRVPYDNYPALLHKGEMVLTAAQASAYRFTGSAGGGGGIDAGALASAMSGLAVEMDGRVVGRLVERSVSAQQAVRLNRTQYGRG